MALGDSFSSGEGVPPFDTKDSGTRPFQEPYFFCHRSKYAYARVFAADTGIQDVKLFACSRATTQDFIGHQVSKGSTTKPQLERIDQTTTLISLTIGGNDVKFAKVLIACAALFHCQHVFPGKAEKIRRQKSTLEKLYRKIAGDAPDAQIYVLGYPRIFSARGRFCSLFDRSERRWFRELTSVLDFTIEDAVALADPTESSIHYVNTLHAFDHNEICAKSMTPYVNGRVKKPNRIYSYHPNRAGQAALAKALKDAYTPPPARANGATPCVANGAEEALQQGNLIEAEADFEALESPTQPTGDPSAPPQCAIDGLLAARSAELTLLQAITDESAGLQADAKKIVADLAATYPEADYTLFLQTTYASIQDPAAAVRTIAALRALGSIPTLGALGFGRAAEHLLTSLGASLQLPNGVIKTLNGISKAGPFGAAVLLERAGLHEEALAEFKKVLAADPEEAVLALTAPGHPKQLDTLREKAREEEGFSWWADFKRGAIALGKVIGEILLVLLLALIVLRMVRASLRSPTEIKDFVDSDATGATKTAKDVTALVRVAVDRLSADLPSTNINVVNALEASITLPTSVVSDIPEVKFFAALVDLFQKLLPQRGWTVTGQLLSKSTRGEGLALRLAAANGHVLAETELWQADYSTTSAQGADQTVGYDRLAIPAAVWVTYHITDAIRERGFVRHPVTRSKLWYRRKQIPTLDWRSYACFAVAARLQHSDPPTATFLYEKALSYDSANKAALYNRAVLDIMNEDWDLAADRLNRLGDELAKTSDDWDPLLYRRYYMSAVLTMNREIARVAATPGTLLVRDRFEEAKRMLEKGLWFLELKLKVVGTRSLRRKPLNRALSESLEEFEGPFVFALAGVAARLEAWPPTPAPRGGA